MSLAVLVPSLGIGRRPSLRATLDSIAPQVTQDDEVVVVTEGYDEATHLLIDSYSDEWTGDWIYGHPDEPGPGLYGHDLANHALNTVVTAEHICRVDDDDVFTPNALALFREAACDKAVIFKATWGPGHPANGVTLWQDRRIVIGNVATPMAVAPLCQARFHPPAEPFSMLEQAVIDKHGAWYCADTGYFQDLAVELGWPEWREEVVCIVRPVAL